jgi:CubicO group peptidase (beta-lactamase class C family)
MNNLWLTPFYFARRPLLLGLVIIMLAAISAAAQQDPPFPPVPSDGPEGLPLPEELGVATDPMIIYPLPEEPPPARESNRQDLIFGSGDQWRIYLPLVQNDASPDSYNPPPTATTTAVSNDGSPSCPDPLPWISRHHMTISQYEEGVDQYWEEMGFRPISVSANGSGSDIRFNVLWIKDDQDSWAIHHGLTPTAYNDIVNDYADDDLRPIAVDAYGSGANLRYTAIWVQDTTPFAARHGLDEEAMNAELAEWEADGFRPIWVTGHEGGSEPHFAALGVFDDLEGTARIGLTRAELAGAVGQAMTDSGFRLLHISGYLVDDKDDPERFAATWVKDAPECGLIRWEAFPQHSSTQYQIKASAQTSLGEMKTVVGQSITLGQGDLGGLFRIAHLPLRHFVGTGGIAELSSIHEETPGQIFQHGDILVLRLVHDDRVLVRERSWGNIRLRPWDATDPEVGEQCDSGSDPCPEIEGQPFFLNDHQYRLLLQYDANDGLWYELQRNGVSPDFYRPLTLDEYGLPDERHYASVWVARETARTWRVTGPETNEPDDPLLAFDQAMRRYMETRNVPAGALAIVKDGRLVLARGYTWDVPEATDINPQRRFRLASVSKSLTAVGIMQLVESGQISLNQKIVDIPGMETILLPPLWIDQRIQDVTVRHLLHHLGGWDRDISGDSMLADFQVCQNASGTLPTTPQAIINYMRLQPFDHDPGTVYAYSNFGYTLLGRIIEVVSGQSYAAYMQDHVFTPAGMQYTQLAQNTDVYLDWREVRYYQPMNQMASSRLGFNDDHPYREICNWQHANQVPDAYGGLNLAPMDAHGGWSSTAVDLARFLAALEDETLISPYSRALMWQRPAERTRRVYAQLGDTWRDISWQARGNGPIILMGATTENLAVGKGLTTFGTIDVQLTEPGQGYTLAFRYFDGTSWVPLTEADHNLQDETENFTVCCDEVKITFTPPDDWTPIVLSGTNDTQPRYWVLIRTTTTPGQGATAEKLFPSGEANYALGWSVGHSEDVSYWLPYTPLADIFVGETVIGQQSRASGVVDQVFHEQGGPSWLRLLAVEGGPFMPGELITVLAAPRGEVLASELAPNVVASHNGLLRGTITEFKHRRDGIHWVVLFNHDKRGAFYIRSDSAGQVRLDTLINDIDEADWPNYDLFDLYP